jgi:hypothetical protein
LGDFNGITSSGDFHLGDLKKIYSNRSGFNANRLTLAGGYNDTGYVAIDSGSTTVMQVDASTDHGGKVVIGVDAEGVVPESRLHIVGDIKTTSHITASGNISSSGNVSASDAWIKNDLLVSDKIYIGETDNYIDEQTDNRLRLVVGGTSLINIVNSTANFMSSVANFRLGIGTGTTPTPPKALTVEGDISSSGGFHVSQSGGVRINSDNTGSFAESFPHGAFSVNYGDGIQATGSLSSVGDGYGDIVKFGSTTGMTVGALYYLNSSGGWTKTNASDNSKGADELLAVALGTNSDIDGMLLRGMVTLTVGGTTVVGAAVYMKGSDGGFYFEAPSSNNNIVRIVGYCVGTDGSNETVYFNPSSTWVKVSA